MTDTLHGIILSLVILNLLNSVLVVALILLIFYTVKEMRQVCDQIKNMLLVSRKLLRDVDTSG